MAAALATAVVARQAAHSLFTLSHKHFLARGFSATYRCSTGDFANCLKFASMSPIGSLVATAFKRSARLSVQWIMFSWKVLPLATVEFSEAHMGCD